MISSSRDVNHLTCVLVVNATTVEVVLLLLSSIYLVIYAFLIIHYCSVFTQFSSLLFHYTPYIFHANTRHPHTLRHMIPQFISHDTNSTCHGIPKYYLILNTSPNTHTPHVYPIPPFLTFFIIFNLSSNEDM